MSLTKEERTTLVALELKKAHETFEEIEILTTANRWSGAANRFILCCVSCCQRTPYQ
jgi:hypothetical protein